ncbi:MAG TPA: DHA2 family efflux MFS transporter permease subunit [Streptosporangiaceae bacterium]
MAAKTVTEHPAGPLTLGPLVQFSLLAGPFLSMVDSSVVNVAVPAMARSFGASLIQLQWVVSGYLLALATGLAASAYLARRWGTRQVYVASLAGFTLASVACALAGSASWLVAARVIQGLLGAPMTPLAMGMMFAGDDTRRRISPAAGIALFLPPALGPALGGLLVTHIGWPSIFLINLPVGAAAITGLLRLPPGLAPGPAAVARFDPAGLVLISGGLALSSYGAVNGPAQGWLSPGSWPFWLTGLALLAGYAAWARRRPHPAVGLGLLSSRGPALAVGLSVLAAVVLFAALFLIPAYVQGVQGMSATEAGLVLLPQGLVMAAGTILGDVLSRRQQVRGAAIGGTAILALTTSALLLIQATTPAWMTSLLLCGRGLALGLIIQPLLTATLSELPAAELADANTLFNVVDRVGGSFGVGLIATFFQASVLAHIRAIRIPVGVRVTTHGSLTAVARLAGPARTRLQDAATAGFHDAIWVLVAIAGLAFLLSLLFPAAAGQPCSAPASTS